MNGSPIADRVWQVETDDDWKPRPVSMHWIGFGNKMSSGCELLVWCFGACALNEINRISHAASIQSNASLVGYDLFAAAAVLCLAPWLLVSQPSIDKRNTHRCAALALVAARCCCPSFSSSAPCL